MNDLPVAAATGAAVSRRRTGDGRQRLLAAATRLFCDAAYFSVSVEDIAAAAGVSRMTFYRHFAGKAALAGELFEGAAERAMPRLLALRDAPVLDAATVRGWIAGLFAADRASRSLLRAFIQASAEDAAFTASAQALVGQLIAGLGAGIPAFALDPADPAQHRRWLEAWLLLYELLDQSNHAALRSGVAADPLVIDILADRFLAFVRAA